MSLERGFHLTEIEWHGFTATDLLDAVVHVLNQLLATPQQADRVVEGFGSIVIQAGGDSPDEKLFVFRRQAAAHIQPQVKRGPTAQWSIRPYIFASTPPGPRLSPCFGRLPAMTAQPGPRLNAAFYADSVDAFLRASDNEVYAPLASPKG